MKSVQNIFAIKFVKYQDEKPTDRIAYINNAVDVQFNIVFQAFCQELSQIKCWDPGNKRNWSQGVAPCVITCI